ncbi:MAG: hypothetical protein OXC54_02695 [Rhodospirillaceae bacterium]|nr:hypothetical protein [Rhodospirillaceae bacterium]MCY4310212.1 hypothetical protein [Rhodospirillaceae bacterium]
MAPGKQCDAGAREPLILDTPPLSVDKGLQFGVVMALSDCCLPLVESDVVSRVLAVFGFGLAVAFVLFLA